MQQLVAMVCSSLDSAMKQLFPRCRAIPFGSSVTGLSLTGSDLDVFLDIREPIIEDDDSTLGCPSGWTPKTIFKGVKRVFYKNRPVFTQIVPIPMAKIPVIKFHHTASDMDCDISFKDGLGVHNSQLIKYLLTLDSRIKPLVVILKYWARNLDISGSGKINNYSLVMLIVFYLQQASVNLLPSIKELQKVHQRVYIREWQVNFNTDYPSTSENNSSSLLELLQGFFKFYSDFDFSTRIIRPLEGSSVLRKEFKKEMEACHRSRYVESLHLDRHACLQDPIQLDYNITSGWATKEIQGLKLSCLLALEVFESMRETPLGIIPRLLEPEMNVKLKASIKAKTKKKMNPTVSFTILAGKFKTFGLPEDFEENNVEDSQKFIEKNWFCTVYRLLEVILEKIFMLQIQVVYDKVGVKQMKLQEEDDVHTNNEDNILLNCSGKYPLHKRRKGKGQIVQPNVSPIQREIITSEKIVKEIDSKTADTPIKFQCLVVKKSNPLHALVELTDQELTNNCFMELAVYMQCKVHSWIEKEFMHMVQFKKNVWTSNES
uniref:Tut1_1 protein n=1 Tax=Fopius arisanus TaxID=64838 RepID=A0A0C9RTJ9_9HYME